MLNFPAVPNWTKFYCTHNFLPLLRSAHLFNLWSHLSAYCTDKSRTRSIINSCPNQVAHNAICICIFEAQITSCLGTLTFNNVSVLIMNQFHIEFDISKLAFYATGSENHSFIPGYSWVRDEFCVRRRFFFATCTICKLKVTRDRFR